MNRGVYPTMITPYTKDGAVDYEAAKQLVTWYGQQGCNGIFAVCQSSEMFYLSLKERVKLAETTVQAVKESGYAMSVVASGHISEDIEAQAEEITAIAQTGVDSVVLVSNRLDLHHDGDKVWIKNAEALLSKIPADVKLGIYECPYPYKRLLTEEIFRWCLSTGRFSFIKDTCCDPDLLQERLTLLKGTPIEIFNANAQTLLQSMQQGAAGYSGVMANFHPDLYVWLTEHWKEQPQLAEEVQAFLCLAAFTESMAYPVTAKYYQSQYGVPMELHSRSRDPKELSNYQKLVVEQLRLMEEKLRAKLA